jgi:hypothetical protein
MPALIDYDEVPVCCLSMARGPSAEHPQNQPGATQEEEAKEEVKVEDDGELPISEQIAIANCPIKEGDYASSADEENKRIPPPQREGGYIRFKKIEPKTAKKTSPPQAAQRPQHRRQQQQPNALRDSLE